MRFLGGLMLICIALQVDGRAVDGDLRVIDEEVTPDELDSVISQYDNSLNELTVPWNLLAGAQISNVHDFHNYDKSMLQEEDRSFDIFHFGIELLRCGKDIIDYEPGNIKDVFFTLYNRNVPGGWRVTNWDELSQHFDKSKKTKFVTHGWTSDGSQDDCTVIKDAYMEKQDYNVFVFDWNAIGGSCRYFTKVVGRLSDVAEEYAKFLNYLVDDVGADPKDIHLIGHSLGAHVTGFAGRRMKDGKKVGRITGLDPAGPGFDWGPGSGTFLNADDAEFVDAIHTGIGFLGFGTTRSAAHADFFPNGGQDQPECAWNLLALICNHHMSYKLFANSIKMENEYIASKCSERQPPTWNFFGYTSFNFENNCRGDERPMGESTPPDTRGIYYLNRN